MLIIKSKYLKEKIYNKNLIPQEVSSLALTNKVYLNINNIEEFLNFASELNLKYIYYCYTYYSREKYIIPTDWYSEYPNEFKVAVSQHNQQIASLDFESPNKLTLFTLQNGTFVGVELTNFWIENQGISVAEEIIEVFESKYYREVKKINATKKDQQKDEEIQLRETIFNDPEFQYCKNQELRYWYLVELLEKEDMRKYEYMVQPPGIPHMGKIKMFMDKTWILFKERQKLK